MEKTTSEEQATHAKGKWRFSGGFQDLRRRNKHKKKTASEGGATHANWKWSFSGILQELLRRNKRKKLTRIPGVRQSILAILKTSCKTFTSHRCLAQTLSDCSVNRFRVERAPHLYTAFCANFLPSSVDCGLKLSCSGLSTFSISTMSWFPFVSIAFICVYHH